MNKFLQYFYNIFVLLSKLVNTLFGGSPHYTISMALGKARYEQRMNFMQFHIAEFIDSAFRFLFNEENHTRNAYLGKEGKAKSLWR